MWMEYRRNNIPIKKLKFTYVLKRMNECGFKLHQKKLAQYFHIALPVTATVHIAKVRIKFQVFHVLY
jgi:hypothetical protein